MRTTPWLLAALLLPALALPLLTFGADNEPAQITWKKTIVDKKFRSEGVAVADVNKDGKPDILIGEVWYEAPDWKMHEMRKPARDYGNGLGNYSESFLCWADDINGDGYPDCIVIRFPGAPCYWYENPQGKPEHWKEHLLWDNACNETPQYVDLFGNGKRVLVMGVQPKGKDDQGQMAYFTPGKDPTQPWELHPISEPSAPGKEIPGTRRFSHGLGIGDVNGDGRLDVICTGGWWEQPEKTDGQTPWKFHPAKLGDACADMYALDMNGDGRADILSSSAHQFGIWWHEQRGDKDNPEFIKHDLFRELLSETHAMHFVDINGDGMKDLVTGKRWWSHGRNEPGSDWPAMLYWFEASRDKNGLVHFRPHVIDTDSGIGTQFAVADINGDGLLDVITANKKGVFIHEQVRSPGTTRATDK
jgi:hypothetical protein